MKAILQRVTDGCVTVNNEIVGQIETGFVILLGVAHTDTIADVDQLAQKVVHLRVFSDGTSKMNHSLLDVRGAALVVSQFTLYADTRKGRRPSYTNAAPPKIAAPLVEAFVTKLSALGIQKVETGIFGANMQVDIRNDGPVTIILETEKNNV